MSDPVQTDTSPASSSGIPFKITIFTLLLAVILGAAFVTRFYRLGEPGRCYFDEVYFPTTAALILKGDDASRNFFGSENTHPPLSKLFMAVGQGVFGTTGSAEDNGCWGDDEDEAKRADPDWHFEPFGWRFFGALFGAASVLFMYLIAKRLFHSEIAGLAAAFILTFEGLSLVQARIATPDAYVQFFMLGSIYFLLWDRRKGFLLSGLFLGAALASKWNVVFIFIPIAFYFAWKLYRGISETADDKRLRQPETMMIAGLGLLALGGLLAAIFNRDAFVESCFDLLKAVASGFDFSEGDFNDLIPALPLLLAGGLALYAGVLSIASNRELRATARGRVYLSIATIVPLYFLAVPLCVYALSYTVWVAQGGSVVEAIEQNKSAYHFHSTLTADHGYQSSFWEWPIMGRPIYLAVGEGEAKIYSMGNPWLFWLGIPALAFTLFQGINRFRLRLNEQSGILTIRPRVVPGQLAPLFVVLGFLALWLPWALNPRTLFLYHYLPAVAFMVMAMGYCIHWLWHNRVNVEIVVGAAAAIAAFTLNRLGHTGTVPDSVEYGVIGVGAFGVAAIMIGVLKIVQGVEPTRSPIKGLHWGQIAALGLLVLIAGTFIYFYPHMTHVDVSSGLDRSYFWFNSWR